MGFVCSSLADPDNFAPDPNPGARKVPDPLDPDPQHWYVDMGTVLNQEMWIRIRYIHIILTLDPDPYQEARF